MVHTKSKKRSTKSHGKAQGRRRIVKSSSGFSETVRSLQKSGTIPEELSKDLGKSEPKETISSIELGREQIPEEEPQPALLSEVTAQDTKVLSVKGSSSFSTIEEYGEILHGRDTGIVTYEHECIKCKRSHNHRIVLGQTKLESLWCPSGPSGCGLRCFALRKAKLPSLSEV